MFCATCFHSLRKVLQEIILYSPQWHHIFRKLATIERSLLCSSSKAHSSQVRGAGDGVSKVGPRAGDKIADPRWDAGLLGDLEDEVVGEDSRAGWLPDTDVTHDCGGETEVPPDSSEVEGSDGSNESLQSPLLNPVPNIRGMVLGVDLNRKGDI